jgi:putative ABC transport system permease protein
MIAHVWKLMWNRKRANALILAELLVAFLVLAGLGTSAAYYLRNYREPLGYSIEDVWAVDVGHGIARREGTPPESLARAQAITRQLLQTVRELPGVLAVTGTITGPYVRGTRNTEYSDGDDVPARGRNLEWDVDSVTDGFAEVFGLTLVKGRWFGKEDDGSGVRPTVINERMVRDFFGDEDPIGQRLGTGRGPNGERIPVKVVGVVAGYRQKGDLAPPLRYQFTRYLPGSDLQLPYHKLFVRTRPGTGAGFEELLEKRLRATASPEWSFTVERLEDVRAGVRENELMPLKAAAIIATFLMLMVVLGLTGVLWQNVTRRTREIGLRRAKGATRPHVYGQILGELMVMTFVAVVVGGLLLAHFPFLNPIADLTAASYVQGGAAAALVLFALTALCGFYPARLAARVEPALALRSD